MRIFSTLARCAHPSSGALRHLFPQEVKMGYLGVIGMEAWPQGDDDLAVKRFREVFAL